MKALIVTKTTLLLAIAGTFTVLAAPQQTSTAESFREQYLERFQNYKASYLNRWEEYHAKVAEIWGDQTLLSTNHAFISYSDDLNERSIIDFENNTISIDVIIEGDAKGPSRDELVRVLKRFSESSIDELAKNDPVLSLPESGNVQSILSAFASGLSVDELISTAEIITETIPIAEVTADAPEPLPMAKSEIEPSPVPLPKPEPVQEAEPELVVVPEPVQEAEPEPVVVPEPEGKRIERVTLRLSDTSIFTRRAEPFIPAVDRLSAQYDIPRDLILAIAQVESSFNPLAQSPIPAFGLMQIVPTSAGLDVNRMMFNLDQPPKEDELFESDFNLEFGTAYLNILYTRYLRNIENPLSRFYCTIAAYNTGAGNVAKVFHPTGQRSLALAVGEINKLTPQQVYNQLLTNLPYQETKDYLPKVVNAQVRYTEL